MTLPADATTSRQTVITGTVRGSDGNPLRHVAVYAQDTQGLLRYPFDGTIVYTNQAGAYRLVVPWDSGVSDHASFQFDASGAVGGTSATGYADGCYRAGSLCSDDAPAVNLNGVATKTVNITLRRAGVISGRVTDRLGRGVGGLAVTAVPGVQVFPGFGNQGVTTDANGNYVIPRADLVTYQLDYGPIYSGVVPATPASDGYLSKLIGTTVVTSGKTLVENQVLVGGGAASGVVVDQAGAPVARAVVSFLLGDSADARTATTAANGTFTLHYLLAGSGKQVCADASQYREACTSIDVVQFRTTTGITLKVTRIS